MHGTRWTRGRAHSSLSSAQDTGTQPGGHLRVYSVASVASCDCAMRRRLRFLCASVCLLCLLAEWQAFVPGARPTLGALGEPAGPGKGSAARFSPRALAPGLRDGRWATGARRWQRSSDHATTGPAISRASTQCGRATGGQASSPHRARVGCKAARRAARRNSSNSRNQHRAVPLHTQKAGGNYRAARVPVSSSARPLVCSCDLPLACTDLRGA